jgi:hypothetical protein
MTLYNFIRRVCFKERREASVIGPLGLGINLRCAGMGLDFVDFLLLASLINTSQKVCLGGSEI